MKLAIITARVLALYKSFWVAMKKNYYARLDVNKIDDKSSCVYESRIFVSFFSTESPIIEDNDKDLFSIFISRLRLATQINSKSSEDISQTRPWVIETTTTTIVVQTPCYKIKLKHNRQVAKAIQGGLCKNK